MTTDSEKTINATKLTAVAMREGSSDIIEVRLDRRNDGLELLHNQQTLSFAEQTWMDLHGEISLISYILILLTTKEKNIPLFYSTKSSNLGISPENVNIFAIK